MAKAKKLPSGSWRVLLYVGTDENGKKKRKSITAATRKEAELLAAQYLNNRREEPAEMTVGKAIDKYIESKSNILSPTTISGYRGIRRNNLQSLMDIKLADITRQAVQQAINHDAVSLSPKSISNAYGLLSAALGVYAPDFNCKVTLPKKQKKIKELPKPEEVFNAIKGTEIELPCLLAMWLSLRMSEVRGLRKSDIQNGKIIIQNSVVTADGKRVEKSATKTYDSTRIEDLPQYISDLINKVETEYITELSGQAIYKRFVRLLDKNGLPHMTFHDLRHLNASVMLQLGVPDKYAMERGGWSTTSTLKSVYQHTFSEEREAVNRKINEYFENIVNDTGD